MKKTHMRLETQDHLRSFFLSLRKVEHVPTPLPMYKCKILEQKALYSRVFRTL